MDSLLGIHETSLLLRSRRLDVLANNLANADTPGFKARDFDFEAALAAATQDPGRTAAAGTASLLRSTQGRLAYRVPFQPSRDGNTVESDMDLSRFAQNAVAYQASLTFISGKISTLRTAITGTL
jgi:flagellar basal-body rod protein FlgB